MGVGAGLSAQGGSEVWGQASLPLPSQGQVRQGTSWAPDTAGCVERTAPLEEAPSMARLSSNLEAIGLVRFCDPPRMPCPVHFL